MKKIAIIGAGISGLFIANLFKKNSDYQVVIYEKNNSINLEEGYGIQLSVNSVKLLNEIEFNFVELAMRDHDMIQCSRTLYQYVSVQMYSVLSAQPYSLFR